jgi:hypothetical protein
MKYAVLNPRGVREDIERHSLSPRLKSLAGKTVYCVAQDRSIFMEELANHLTKYAPGVKTVFRIKPGGFAVESPELHEEIVKNADAMIYGTSMGGGSGMAGTGRVIEVEKRGIPSVNTVGEPFVPDIKVSAEMRGMPDLRIVPIHLVEEVRVKQDITEEQYKAMISKIVDALTSPLTEEEKKKGKIVTAKPPRIAMSGTLDEVQDYFYQQHWTDGLPIIPPTEEKVKEMLKGTSHAPGEVVTTRMWPEELTATVEKVAIVGAMAGCKPEYMPVLLAMVKAWGKGGSFNMLVRSGSSASTMTIVNGPVRREIGMNPELNAMGPCNQANASIGRFLRMAIINLGGSRPGVNDMSALGSPVKYGFCFPEHEEENPWKPFHVSLGFKPDESAVSIMIGGWHHMSIFGGGQTPDSILGSIAKAIVSFQGQNGALITMAPGMVRLCAADGMSKDDIEQYIWEHAAVRMSELKMLVMPPRADLGSFPDDAMINVCKREALKVVVVGGETGQPVAHVWSESPPSSESVDNWR